MKDRKRALAIILCLVLCLSLMPTWALAEQGEDSQAATVQEAAAEAQRTEVETAEAAEEAPVPTVEEITAADGEASVPAVEETAVSDDEAEAAAEEELPETDTMQAETEEPDAPSEAETALTDELDTLVPAEAATRAEVDKSQLEQAIAYTEGLNEADYTAESWASVKANLSTAKTVMAKSDATQEEVDNAVADLDNAVAALEEKQPEPFQFSDVADSSAYYYNPVYWAADNGITSGTSPTTFSPGKDCTRGQIVTFLWKSMGSPEPNSTNNPFTDVKTTDYFYNPVLWAKEKGITSGKTATSFAPGAPCTRGQIVTFRWIAKGRPEPSSLNNPFSDVKTSDYFFKAVLWAKENGITSGTSATAFSPRKTCTRAQAMTFLYKAHDLPVNPDPVLKPMEWSFTCSAAENTSWAEMGHQFGQYLSERTDGKIKVTVYTSDSITGSPIAGIDAVSSGEIELGGYSNQNFAIYDERFLALTLPFNFDSVESVDLAVERGGAGYEALADAARQQGLHLLGIGEGGFRHVTNSRHEIKSPADFEGLKIRVANTSLLMDTYSALGANPVAMSASELYTALQMQVIDGQDNTISTADRYSLSAVNKYCTWWTALYDGIIFCMNQELYDSLPEAIQVLVDEAGAWAAAQQRTAARAEEQTIIEKWKNDGVTFTYLTSAQTQAFRTASAGVVDQWASDCVQHGISKAEMDKLLQAFRQ